MLVDTDAEGVASPSAVASAIGKLHADHDLRAALSRAAYELATAPRFSWDHVAAQWRELLLGVTTASIGAT